MSILIFMREMLDMLFSLVCLESNEKFGIKLYLKPLKISLPTFFLWMYLREKLGLEADTQVVHGRRSLPHTMDAENSRRRLEPSGSDIPSMVGSFD